MSNIQFTLLIIIGNLVVIVAGFVLPLLVTKVICGLFLLLIGLGVIRSALERY